MKQQFFVFVECVPGQTYAVAQEVLGERSSIVSAAYSISGEWDLLLRVEFDAARNFGEAISGMLLNVAGVERTYTVIGYPIFDPDDVYFDESGH